MRTGGLVRAFVFSAAALSCGGGGSSTPAGASGDAGASAARDSTAPVVASAPTVVAVSETSVALTWPAAVDSVTPAAKLVYRIYAGETAATVDYGKPVDVTAAGATGTTLTALRSGRRYALVVRAVDEAANEDTNTFAADVTLTDKTPPVFDGARIAFGVAHDAIEVRWAPARDEGDSTRSLKYRIYVATKSGEQSFASPYLESGFGVTSATLRGLAPSTPYYVVVRAVDSEGNTDQNTAQRATKTLEGVAPRFGGVVSATAGATNVSLHWYPAQDDTSATLDVVYDVYRASSPKGETFDAPTFTTAPGATSFDVTGLVSPQTYYFVVRARDIAGNRDTNVVELSASTRGPDITPPVFGGVTGLTSATPTTMRVAWAPATDDVTPAANLVYDVFVAPTAGGETLSTPSFTSLPGATSFLLTGLMTGGTRFVIVRARDAAGNSDSGRVEASATTLAAVPGDGTPPTWTSGPIVSQVASEPTTLGVTWGHATDATVGGVRYHICAEPLEASCMGAAFDAHIRVTTAFGATGAYVTSLATRTPHFVVVRAEDHAGNIELTGHGQIGVTATSFATDVSPLLETRCGACHTYTYDALVKVPSRFTDGSLGVVPLVKPGDASMSYLFRKITPAGSTTSPFSTSIPNSQMGDPMPLDGTRPLTADEAAPLRDWIEQGAYER